MNARLSDDDVRILAGLAAGRGTDVLARDLGLSERTLRRRVRDFCDDLGGRTPIEAVVRAVRRGLI